VPLNLSPLPRFANQIVQWQKLHGRHDLPWQNTRDPYKVWLSEIMLQQTQVATVLGYFDRFLIRFPTVKSLAAASLDDVLGLWSGLGYYSRARNMHRCAQEVMALHGGKFPGTAAKLQSLPGIGPSTAAAIASFCYSERIAILDSNVKRVLTRVLAFKADLSQSANERALWAIANTLPPKLALTEAMPRYTQGLMDLGATVCTSRKPACKVCPVQRMCAGMAEGDPEKYPVKTRKLKRSALPLWLLWAQTRNGAVWLTKRPDTGIWGGLYCLPVFESEEALLEFAPLFTRDRIQALPSFKHVLTHKDLQLNPIYAEFSSIEKSSFDLFNLPGRWCLQDEYLALGLPAPIRKLLQSQPF
jgi:A/G-specific adenine glycosylase